MNPRPLLLAGLRGLWRRGAGRAVNNGSHSPLLPGCACPLGLVSFSSRGLPADGPRSRACCAAALAGGCAAGGRGAPRPTATRQHLRPLCRQRLPVAAPAASLEQALLDPARRRVSITLDDSADSKRFSPVLNDCSGSGGAASSDPPHHRCASEPSGDGPHRSRPLLERGKHPQVWVFDPTVMWSSMTSPRLTSTAHQQPCPRGHRLEPMAGAGP